MFYIAIVLLIGLVFGQLATLIKLPSVTGYLVGGLIVGPSLLGVLSPEIIDSLDIVEEVALAFIAFTVGLSFKRSYFKRVGFGPVIIALFESAGAVLIVTAGLLLIGVDLAFAIMLGAIAAATDPASTIMVIREYKAKGPLTETLLSVVALDDAMALILFGFASAIARTIVQTQGELSLLASVLSPFIDIFLAVLIGGVLGFLMKWPLKYFQTSSNRLVVLITFVFLASGISVYFGVSELLTIMIMGAVLTNISLVATKMSDLSDRITTPIYVMFFVVSGAGLDISVIPTVGFVGLVYIVLRVAGKITGAYFGASIAHTPKTVSRYLGLTLIPQAGVAIGLTAIAESIVPMYATQIKVVVLCSTLIYALVGPLTTTIALSKAGEISKG